MASLGAWLRQVAQQGRYRANGDLPLVGVGLCLCTAVWQSEEQDVPLTSSSRSSREGFWYRRQKNHDRRDVLLQHFFADIRLTKTSCDGLLEVETVFPETFNESDRFFQVLEYHRTLLPDYTNRWGNAPPPPPGENTWPRKIPATADIPALEMDYKFCKRQHQANNDQSETRACQDLQFRIGTYYVTTFQNQNHSKQMIGYRMIKDLAERGHPDGMCYYGKTQRVCLFASNAFTCDYFYF